MTRARECCCTGRKGRQATQRDRDRTLCTATDRLDRRSQRAREPDLQPDLQPARHCPSTQRPPTRALARAPRDSAGVLIAPAMSGDGPAEMNGSPAHSRPQAPLHAGTRWRLTGIPHLRTSHSHVHNHRHNHFLLSSLKSLYNSDNDHGNSGRHRAR